MIVYLSRTTTRRKKIYVRSPFRLLIPVVDTQGVYQSDRSYWRGTPLTSLNDSFCVSTTMLEAIDYQRGRLRLLDQRKLPHETIWIDICDTKDGWTAIRNMTVRGAPAIAIAGMLSLAVELVTGGQGMQFESVEAAELFIEERLEYLETSRPTAVNLFIAVKQLKELVKREVGKSDACPTTLVTSVVMAAEDLMAEDISSNKVMGGYGADAMLAAAQARGRGQGDKIRVLTHCNTGSLATAAYGTALGVVRSLFGRGQLEHVYCTETRPYNQGARLTAFEIATDNMPGTLLCDSAVASLMQNNKVDAVVVGADRIANNGDTANKIGTFNIAVAAAYHNIPFFVAAPTTTIDVELANGTLIPIEQRSPEEITHFMGKRVAAELPVWNPSFDVTPATLIEGIITERGMAPRMAATSAFNLKEWLAESTLESGRAVLSEESVELTTHQGIPDFQEMTVSTAIEYVVSRPHLAIHVGSRETVDEWNVEEIGDGNLNYVYIVRGPQGAVCIKQSPPFVRVIGADWPLSQNRTRIEADALAEQGKHCASIVPSVLHYDESGHTLVMQYIPPPHISLRHGLIDGNVYPMVGEHLITFLSRTLFKTSYLGLDCKEFRAMAGRFANEDLCALTEQVIFSDPYFCAQNNRHNTPYLDDIVNSIHKNEILKLNATKMKAVFVEKKQALLHGDLHTGSILVSPESTYMIDPEFAFVGPIGFDVGKIIANFLLNYFAADGHSEQDGVDRCDQKAWLLSVIVDLWRGFRSEFVEQWNEVSKCTESKALCWIDIFRSGDDALSHLQASFLADVWADTLGFLACVIIRRIIGVAHVDDFEKIANPAKRSVYERRALLFAVDVLEHGVEKYDSIESIVQHATTC